MAAQRIGLVSLERIRIPSDVCEQANSILMRFVWKRNFLNPVRKSCGFKHRKRKPLWPNRVLIGHLKILSAKNTLNG